MITARVVARIRRATGVEVPIRTIFDGSTVAVLAEALEDLPIEELEGPTRGGVGAARRRRIVLLADIGQHGKNRCEK